MAFQTTHAHTHKYTHTRIVSSFLIKIIITFIITNVITNEICTSYLVIGYYFFISLIFSIRVWYRCSVRERWEWFNAQQLAEDQRK